VPQTDHFAFLADAAGVGSTALGLREQAMFALVLMLAPTSLPCVPCCHSCLGEGWVTVALAPSTLHPRPHSSAPGIRHADSWTPTVSPPQRHSEASRHVTLHCASLLLHRVVVLCVTLRRCRCRFRCCRFRRCCRRPCVC
jgi:hypothetical protein